MRLTNLAWLLLMTSCTTPVSKQKQEADIKEVLEQAFMHERLASFLARPGSSPFSFRYEELPVYNGSHLPKPDFSILFSKHRLIRYDTRMKDELESVPILVEQLIIDYDSATVNLRIPKQGVIGQFRLSKNAAGIWHVTKALVVET